MKILMIKINQKRGPFLFLNVLLILFCFSLSTITYSATELTLQWDWDIPIDPNIDGYRIYYKEITESNYTLEVDLPSSMFSYPDNTPEFIVTGLIDTIVYQFVITAYNTYGESDYSNIVSTDNLSVNNEDKDSSIGVSESGGGCFISSASH